MTPVKTFVMGTDNGRSAAAIHRIDSPGTHARMHQAGQIINMGYQSTILFNYLTHLRCLFAGFLVLRKRNTDHRLLTHLACTAKYLVGLTFTIIRNARSLFIYFRNNIRYCVDIEQTTAKPSTCPEPLWTHAGPRSRAACHMLYYYDNNDNVVQRH